MDFYEKFNVLRPLPNEHNYDRFNFPIIKKQIFPSNIDWNNIQILNFKNATSKKIKNTKNVIITKFNSDKILERDYNNLLKNVPVLSKYLAVCTPDFSIYPGMNENIIRYNVFRNRYVGCLYEDLRIPPIPTLSWCDDDTYDMCFSGIEYNMPVVFVSTLGCQDRQEIFIKGYKEMMRRLNPQLVLIYGNPIKGIFGRIKIFNYTDGFNNEKRVKDKLFEYNTILDIEEDGYYGW